MFIYHIHTFFGISLARGLSAFFFYHIVGYLAL